MLSWVQDVGLSRRTGSELRRLYRFGTHLKPVVARPSVGQGHDLAHYGVGQFGCAVRDVVIGMRCEKFPFGVVELEISGCGETKVRHNEMMASRQDVVEVGVEVH